MQNNRITYHYLKPGSSLLKLSECVDSDKIKPSNLKNPSSGSDKIIRQEGKSIYKKG